MPLGPQVSLQTQWDFLLRPGDRSTPLADNRPILREMSIFNPLLGPLTRDKLGEDSFSR